MKWYWYLIAIVAIILELYLASLFYEVACEKGHKEKRYFWIPAIFGIVGYLLVVALPDRKNITEKPAEPLIKVVETPGNKWVCPECGAARPHDVIQCSCGYRR